jgi:hypothetical protein
VSSIRKIEQNKSQSGSEILSLNSHLSSMDQYKYSYLLPLSRLLLLLNTCPSACTLIQTRIHILQRAD